MIHAAFFPLLCTVFPVFPILFIAFLCGFIDLFAAFLHSTQCRTLCNQYHTDDQHDNVNNKRPDQSKCLTHVISQTSADDAATDTTAATTASETVNTDNDHNSSLSIGLVAAALATGLAGIGGGMAVASAAPAAIAANSENEKTFGKSLIFVALGESIALYGLVISIMILSKLV